jgi:hypothetical protein
MSRTQRDRVLGMLLEAGGRGVTTAEFLGARIPRFSGRVLELRRDGYRIASSRLGRGEWRYTLLDEPDLSPPSPTTTIEPEQQIEPEQPADAGSLFDDAAYTLSDAPSAHTANSCTHWHRVRFGPLSRPSDVRPTGPHGEEL